MEGGSDLYSASDCSILLNSAALLDDAPSARTRSAVRRSAVVRGGIVATHVDDLLERHTLDACMLV
jgi:hypothetical protein